MKRQLPEADWTGPSTMDRTPHILVVEDEQGEREAMARVLRMKNYTAVTAENPQGALSHVNEPIDLVISDLKLGQQSGVDLLREWKRRHPHTPFIIVTAYGDVETAVAAMKMGAEDYLTKPIDPGKLLEAIGRCLEGAQARLEPVPGDEELKSRPGFENIVARSKVMMEIFDQTWRAAQTESTVLIVGESGTGKELIAEAIHRNSPRSDKPFVTVNMAAIPENLVESELFGHMKGAFTGATTDRIGRFKAAGGGTLFIDEIGDFELSSQAKLLRVLENNTITPVGSNDDELVDVRVVAATSRDLHEMLYEETFREDLYYRLNVVTIELPPLRERREDIRPLVYAFLKECCRANDRPMMKVEPELMRFFESFDWPGNVRQLRNCVESMVVMAQRDVLPLEEIPAYLEPAGESDAEEIYVPQDTTLDELERTAIEQALERFQGNRTRAAESLGISVRTLQRRIKDWDLGDEED